MSLNVKLRTFLVDDALFDVEMSLPADQEAPVTYTVGWSGGSTKLVFQTLLAGAHYEILLAALDQLEANDELTLEQATTPVRDILEV